MYNSMRQYITLKKGAGMRKRSMAYFMQSENLLDGDIENLLDFILKCAQLM